MSQSTIIAWIVAIVIVLGGGYYWYTHQGASSNTGAPAAVTNQPAPAPLVDTSDAAVAQDASAIDGMMSALTADNANADASLKDQPVAQTY